METCGPPTLVLYLKILVLVTAINVPNLCLYQKVHKLPQISSNTAGLVGI